MKAELIRRLGVLEQCAAPAERLVVWRSFVRPGAEGPVDIEAIGVQGSYGWSMTRAPLESLEAFRVRAEASAPANEAGVVVLNEVIAEEVA